MLLTSAAGAGGMLYMQSRFDTGDQQSALALARTYRAPNGRTLPDLIAAEHPGTEPQWTARTESSCFGHERVRADIATSDGGHESYEFLVDINGPSIHPGSPSGERIVTELNR